MRFELDLHFLAADGRVLATRRLRPGRFARLPGAAAVLEVPARGGEFCSPGTWVGVLPQREEIATVVVCEDDAITLDLLCDHLVAERFGVLPAPTASDALRLCRYNHPDLLLLDLALPDASGLDVLREIREADGIDARFDPGLPVIVLTGRTADTDRVRGLESGADDYLTKPFSFPELRARIGAVMRRGARGRNGPSRVGELVIDPARRRVTVGGRRVELSKKEFALLRVLATDPQRVFTKEELLERVWGFRDAGRTRTLDSHASRMRRKLHAAGGLYVFNTWGVGYRLVEG
jgi:DNA-binding response OmpR family regulator